MQCLIIAFRDGRIKKSEIKACKNKAHDTDHLTINYPRKPPLVSCTVPKRYPSTPEYKMAEFAPLPAFAKGKQDSQCTGIIEINTEANPHRKPRHCKCERVTLNGPFSAGALVKCSKCLTIERSTDQDSCPQGTKLFSPRSEMDWKTFSQSAEAPMVYKRKCYKTWWGGYYGCWRRATHVAVDVSSPRQAKTTTGAMNS